MDLLTHVVVGALTGAAVGEPIAGAAIAAAPDLVLGITRKAAPTLAYRSTHSAFGMLVATAIAWACGGWFLADLVFICWCSHLFLDVFTHGRVWGTQLLFPFSNRTFTFGEEWEWFNDTWFFGLWLALFWCSAIWIFT